MTLRRKFIHSSRLPSSQMCLLLREVRRAALLNLPINDKTLPLILDRTRDTDDTNRKLVYNAVLEANVTQGNTEAIGPTHPRALTIAQRELIVKNGLGDRVPAVRAAAASLIARWVEVIVIKSDEPPTENSGVLALLELFDLANGGVAADALLSVFTTNETIFDNLVFGGMFLASYLISEALSSWIRRLLGESHT